jgi:hypothetical protein
VSNTLTSSSSAKVDELHTPYTLCKQRNTCAFDFLKLLKKSLLKIKVGGIFEYVAAKQATNFIKVIQKTS